MRLYFDLDTDRLVIRAGYGAELKEVSHKRGDSGRAELSFHRGEKDATLTGEVTEMVYVVKADFDEETPPLIAALVWTLDEESGIWSAALGAYSELEAALGNQSEVTLKAELTFTTATMGTHTSQTLVAKVGNDLWKGTEGTPLVLPGPEAWLAARALPLPILRTDAQGSPIHFRLTVTGGDYDGTIIDRSTTYASRTLWSSGIFRVEWTGTEWRFLANGVEVDTAVGDTEVPWDAVWGSISITPSGLPATHIGQNCRLGDASPYRWFVAAEIEPTLWEEITPGLVLNRDTQIMERLFILDGILQTEIATL